jgi:hypothetical protein
MSNYSPERHWSDTPEVLRTPKQNSEMYLDIVRMGWPLFILFCGIACICALNDSGRKTKGEKIALQLGSVVFTIGGLFGAYWMWF